MTTSRGTSSSVTPLVALVKQDGILQGPDLQLRARVRLGRRPTNPLDALVEQRRASFNAHVSLPLSRFKMKETGRFF